MSEELKPCPFCGGTKICTEKGINLNYCDSCSAEANIEHWNTRPLEDALQSRIAELEWNNSELTDENAELTLRVTEMETELNLLKQERDFWNEVYREREDANDVN